MKDPAKAKQLEEETGMSRDELERFVKKFDAAPKQPAGAGRTLDVKPGENKTLDPLKPEGFPSATVSGRSQRGPNSVPQDAAGGLTQGLRGAPVPVEYQSRYEAYRGSISGRATRTATPQ